MFENRKLSEAEELRIRDLANTGAGKICRGRCVAGYPCGHANKAPAIAQTPLLGHETECPLAKYNIEPDNDSRPWYERRADELFVSRDEIFAVCAMCRNSTVKVTDDDEYYRLKRNSLELCVDCPVKMTEECMDEACAESAGE